MSNTIIKYQNSPVNHESQRLLKPCDLAVMTLTEVVCIDTLIDPIMKTTPLNNCKLSLSFVKCTIWARFYYRTSMAAKLCN